VSEASIPTILTAILAAVALPYALALRPWRPQLFRRAFAPLLDLFLIAALTSGFLSVQKPELFVRAATAIVEYTALPETLDSVDAELHDLSLLPSRTWEQLKAKLGFTSEEEAEPEPAREPGPATTNVLPAIVDLVSVLMRVFAYLTALLMGSVLLLPRLWLTRMARLAMEREKLHARLLGRIDELEHRVALLSAETE
jgi:hypothetical protein